MLKFLFNFFFIDQRNGHMSHTKFWSNIGYIILCWAFVWAVYQGKTDVDYMIWLFFGAVVIGNRTAKKVFMKDKVNE